MSRQPKMLESKFGGKKALAKLLLSKVKFALGYYNRYYKIDFSMVKRIVFVCKGNISRSPYGHHKMLLCGLESASFGIAAQTGNTADSEAIICAKTSNLSLSEHKSTNLSDFDIKDGDLLLCFEPLQAEFLENYGIEKNAQISLAGLWSEPLRPYIADPYGLHINYYKTCYGLIDNLIDNLKTKLSTLEKE